MSGPGRNKISERKEVKVSCISFFQEVEWRPPRLTSGVSGAMEVGVSMDANSLSSVMKVVV
jgi:hypothetical protein